jgi:long-chain acyl-CoA synthetase
VIQRRKKMAMADRGPSRLARTVGELALPPVPATVGHMLLEAARRAPDAEAIVCGARRLSYAQYTAYALRLAHWLRRKGAEGERVALLLGNSVEMAVASFAVHLSGAQAVLLNPAYTARELRVVLAHSQPLLVLCQPAVTQLIQSIPDLRANVHQVDPGFLDGLPAEVEGFPLPLPAPDSLATLQYTGGTTGQPKGVNLTHAAIATNVVQREALLPTIDRQDRALCITPLFHSYATAMGLHLCAHCAGTLVLLPKYDARDVLDLIEREEITIFLGSPTLFVGLLAHPKFPSADFSSLRVCYSGSAALPAEILLQWERSTTCKIYEGYGQTEAGPVLTYNSPLLGAKPGSVGFALPETTIEIVDLGTGDRLLPQGESGEIRARGPQIMSGYRNAPEETAKALRDGWLYTGDIGSVEEDGSLTIRGRKKEMIIVSGFNVFPLEVESVLLSQGQVREAAVVGVPDSYRGEKIFAFVVPKISDLGEKELLDYCAANLARYKLPARISIVASLPKTSVGKIDKATLAAEAQHN